MFQRTLLSSALADLSLKLRSAWPTRRRPLVASWTNHTFFPPSAALCSLQPCRSPLPFLLFARAQACLCLPHSRGAYEVVLGQMPSRFRNLVGSKRKASGNSLTQSPSNNSLSTNNTTNTLQQSSSPQPNRATQSPPQPASERNSTASNNNTLVQQQQQASASSTSLAMNPHQHPSQQHGSPQPGQQPLGRPPSYQYVNQAGQQQQQLQQQQQMAGRPTSPMPPPPINTQNPYGHLPPHAPQHMYGQQPVSGPPGYPMQAPPQQQQQYGGYVPQQSMVGGQYSYNRGYASEANNQRSKAQLIVGIDFVSRFLSSIDTCTQVLTTV